MEKRRYDANQKSRTKILSSGKTANESLLLNPHEELVLFKHYEKRLLDFCAVFKPTMPKSVTGIAVMYFRRFYLNNSLMDYHPRTIMLTCTYLACKVDEFNVTCIQFVGNLQETPAGQEWAMEQILEYELLLIQQLNFHLVIHTPYRPMEGFLIDLKTRYPMLENPEVLRKSADDFLNRVAMTDAGLLASPSQIALTAMLNSASRAGLNMESYLTECMGLKDDKETLSKLMETMRRIKHIMKKYEMPKPEEVNACKQKLERVHSEFSTTNLKRKRAHEEEQEVVKRPLLVEEVGELHPDNLSFLYWLF